MKPPLREVGLVRAGKPSPHPSLAGGAKEESLPCEGEGLENKIIRDKKAK